MNEDLGELHRAIGRIEGKQSLIIDKLNAMIVDHIQHMKDDRTDFQAIREAIDRKVGDQAEKSGNEAEGLSARITTNTAAIAQLQKEHNQARGAGVVILAALTALASIVGSALLSVFTGHISITLK